MLRCAFASLCASAAAAAAGAGAPLAPLAPSRAAMNVVQIAAQDARVTVAGRAPRDADGVSRNFDWEGVAFLITATNSQTVFLNVTSTGAGLNRVITHAFLGGVWIEQTRQWVLPGANSLLVAAAIDAKTPTLVRSFFELEPAFTGAAGGAYFSVHGFGLDAGGDAGPPTELPRRIEVVGDSISAGYGSNGVAGNCPVNVVTSSNWASYNRLLCDALGANCSIVAWSGKGMYENCCDSGEKMPSYYLQARGGEAYQETWDFSAFVPSMLLINLGTNVRHLLGCARA